ncbi:MAG: substrate-binding domain-containing protein [Myxococcota bacterium]|nr:substrate-binding domain-containing protein [Myxococcota bacterium]
MSDLTCQLKRHREHAGLSQQALARRVGVSRQALSAIEAGRQVPSTRLSLLLARALSCTVEDLFALPDSGTLAVRLPAGARAGRVVLGQVDGQWVGHPLSDLDLGPADGILLESGQVQPLSSPASTGLLVAGCAPLLGLLSQRIGHHRDIRSAWLPVSSGRALSLLAEGLIHVAGLHFFDASSDRIAANRAAIRARFPGRRMVVVNLVCWRQGLLSGPGAAIGLADLTRPGLRFARRAEGSGASKLVRGIIGDQPMPTGPLAGGHLEVARLVRAGAAEAGVAIEPAALAAGLSFLPLSEERFDLVYPAELTGHPGLKRLLDVLTDRPFQTEAAHIPGYDLSRSGTTEAA